MTDAPTRPPLTGNLTAEELEQRRRAGGVVGAPVAAARPLTGWPP